MIRRVVVLPVLVAVACFVCAVPVAHGKDVRFVAYDVIVDPGTDTLGAYQIDVRAEGDAQLVGVENGVAPFDKAPHYDRQALRRGHVIVAAFVKTPSKPGAIRVARLHFQESGTVSFKVKTVAGAKSGGERIALKVRLVPVK